MRASTSPCLTVSPSLKPTASNSPSTCGRTVTLLSALPVTTARRPRRVVGASTGLGSSPCIGRFQRFRQPAAAERLIQRNDRLHMREPRLYQQVFRLEQRLLRL